MSEPCNHDCGSCAANCASRTEPQSLLEPANEHSNVKKVIAVVSGKGGVGKSLITSLLAVLANRRGYKAAVLDADITGPSIPGVFGTHEKAMGTEFGILPVSTGAGIKIMSVNLLLENETDPVVWRGPVIAGAVKQFWSDVVWSDVDYMFVDMPPGTGDVPLTVLQSLPVDGVIVVTSPQELVSMIVEKAVKMAGMLNVPVLGIVENMSYFECPNCHEKHSIFGESNVEAVAERNGIAHVAKLPMDPTFAYACDQGLIERVSAPWLESTMDRIEQAAKIEE